MGHEVTVIIPAEFTSFSLPFYNEIKNHSNDEIILLAELINNKNEAETINNRYKLSANERDRLFFLVENKNKK